jgi:molybdopterin-guanine dinucleotide biosynthesis protein A
MKFSCVIHASGKSKCPGHDQPSVELDQQPSLARQIELVRAAGASEVFIPSRDSVDCSAFVCRVLKEEFPFFGPLAGIERALAVCAHPFLLALSADLPAMQLRCLDLLLAACTDNAGAIPCVNGFCEPLAAFYPRQAHALAKLLLGGGQREARRFADGCVELGLINREEMSATEVFCCINRNAPTNQAGCV